MTKTRRRTFLTHLAAASAGVAVGFAASSAQASRPHVAPGPGRSYPSTSVSISVEHPDGRPFEDFWLHSSRYVAGEVGARYQLRVTNHTGKRVEAVVTVDGRDVVSGQVGDYTTQRGYVLDPWGSVVIDGFRQSTTSVASFRFAGIRDSYSARRGTPQHVGVIGVAVFDEKPKPKPKPRPRPVQPVQPAPDPYPYWYDYEDAAESAPAHNRRESTGGRSKKPTKKSSRPGLGTAGPAPSAEPRGGAADSSADYRRRDYDRSSPYTRQPAEQLGTEYGESRYSRVREVVFKRRSKTKPDALLTLYYDSYDGLRARGVPVDPPEYVYPYTPEPQPFPDRRYAPPPPPRRY